MTAKRKHVKVHFTGESMWVVPTGRYTGTLENDPVYCTWLSYGDEVTWRWRVARKARMRWREWTPSHETAST